MPQTSSRRSNFNAPRLTFLGTIRGAGRLSAPGTTLDEAIDYEIDGYRERDKTAANGRVTGEAATIAWALEAGAARLQLVDGKTVEVKLAADADDPLSAEIELTGRLPAFA